MPEMALEMFKRSLVRAEGAVLTAQPILVLNESLAFVVKHDEGPGSEDWLFTF